MFDNANEIPVQKKIMLEMDDYIMMANDALLDAIKTICENIPNEQITFMVSCKFHLVGNYEEYGAIADATNKKFGLRGEDAFDAKKVEGYVNLVINDASEGKLGGDARSKISLAKSLMAYCNKHAKEF